MEIKIFPDAETVARKGAEIIAEKARAAVKARGRFILAVSGGQTPWQMLRALADEDVPWEGVHVVQVDERVAPEETRIETSPTCVKACLNMPRYARIKSILCRCSRPSSRPGRNATRLHSVKSPARRRCSTSSISASARMATRPPSYRETRF